VTPLGRWLFVLAIGLALLTGLLFGLLSTLVS
jgi:hypothetical protein